MSLLSSYFCNFSPSGCMQNCKTCFSSSLCTECEKGYFLFNNDSQCVKCDSPFMRVEVNRCLSCIENCKICKADSQCSSCEDGYKLTKETLCEKIQNLEPTLKATEIPTIFKLSFPSPSKALIENLHKEDQKLFLFTISPYKGIGF